MQDNHHYHHRRAVEEIGRAEHASRRDVARAHYQLAKLHLDRLCLDRKELGEGAE